MNDLLYTPSFHADVIHVDEQPRHLLSPCLFRRHWRVDAMRTSQVSRSGFGPLRTPGSHRLFGSLHVLQRLLTSIAARIPNVALRSQRLNQLLVVSLEFPRLRGRRDVDIVALPPQPTRGTTSLRIDPAC